MQARREAPADFVPETLFAGIHWHQRWELFPGVWVPGRNPVDFLADAVQLPRDLTGQRVLDVGAWNGCFSFECERRGAAEVVALSLEDPAESGFDRLKQLLESRVEYVRNSVYTLAPAQLGSFDVVLFFGVLYHLRYPLLALDRLRSICGGEVFIETHVIDEHAWLRPPFAWVSRLPLVRSVLRRTPIWRQYRDDELQAGDASNWFGPNSTAVVEAFESAGFAITPTRSWGNRAAFRARAADLPRRLLDLSYEGWQANRALIDPAHYR